MQKDPEMRCLNLCPVAHKQVAAVSIISTALLWLAFLISGNTTMIQTFKTMNLWRNLA